MNIISKPCPQSLLYLCLPHPNLKRHTRTCPPALFLLNCHTTESLPTRKAESVPPSYFPTASSFLRWAAPFSMLAAHGHLLRFSRGLHPGLLNCPHYPVHTTSSSLRQGCLHSSPRFLSQHLVHPKHSLCSAVSEGCSCTKWGPLARSMNRAGPLCPLLHTYFNRITLMLDQQSWDHHKTHSCKTIVIYLDSS